MTQRYLTPKQLADRWEGAVAVGTLANWRSATNQGSPTGPAFQHFGRAVRYHIEDVVAYERANFTGQAANDPDTGEQADGSVMVRVYPSAANDGSARKQA